MPADFVGDPLRQLLGIVFDFNLKEQIRSAHRRNLPPDLYTKKVLCATCKKRRARRFCPGVEGEICTLCCGNEREMSVSCPLDCEFLREARKHERPALFDVEQVPNRDIRITDQYLREHQELLVFMAGALTRAGLGTRGAVDYDVRESLDGLIRTYRTLQSGLQYDSIPENPLAAKIFRSVQQELSRYREQEAARG